MKNGIIIVDHGSRRAESNQLLEQVAALFAQRFGQAYEVVEPAHMEIAEPSIAAAYARCVQRGATRIIVCPFFLGPGKHWTTDIPRLAAEAAAAHPGTRYHVTMPLGLDELIVELLNKRVQFCVGNEFTCDSCRGTVRSGEEGVTAIETPGAAGVVPPPAANQTCASCPFTVGPDGTVTDKRK